LFDLKDSLDKSDRRLYMFFEIFKGMGAYLGFWNFFRIFVAYSIDVVLLNDPNLLETLFNDKYMLQLMGVLECKFFYFFFFIFQSSYLFVLLFIFF
jgi:hypothetical protein